MKLKRCNRTSSWALKVFQVQKDGHYGHGKKITVLFVIEPGNPASAPQVYGSVKRSRWWIQCLWLKGTTTNIFRDFYELVCGDIERNGINGMDDHQIFIWYNLRAHHVAYVHERVMNLAGRRRFSMVPRPQYHPKFGPIKYTICKVTLRLWLKKQADWDMDNLEQQIYRITMPVGQFEPTFLHCEYRK